MRQTTLPPEMLPSVSPDDAEVFVCLGLPRCEGARDEPCPFCVRVSADCEDPLVSVRKARESSN
jgi:hypothetical protein